MAIIGTGKAIAGQKFVLFDDFFKKEKEIILQTENLEIGFLTQLNTDYKNNLIFLDSKGAQVILFDSDGEFIKKIGEKGRGPGEHIIPFGVGIGPNEEIIVSDHASRRINIFDKSGNFLSSFIISGNHWPPNIICSDSKGNIFLSGLKENYEKEGSDTWINKYESTGQYIKSFFSRNNNQEWLLSMSPPVSFDISDEDLIYAVNINKYEISVFDTNGILLRKIGKAPVYFREPDPHLKLDFAKFEKKSQADIMEELTRLSESWTRIFVIKAVEEYLLMGLKTNNLVKEFDKTYVYDIWDNNGDLVKSGIQSDYKFLCCDRDDRLYFLIYTDEEEAEDKDPSYTIGKYKIKWN